MTTTKDLYSTLGVSRGASPEELKRAYRRKAIENHPDRNKGNKEAEERFKDINEAYSVLSDSKKKRIYDQYGYEALRRGAGSSGGQPFGDMGGFSSFSDIFEEAFGGESIFENFFSQGKQASSRQRGGSHLRYELDISLADAFNGRAYDFEVTQKVPCSRCAGKGTQKGTSPITCPDCHGAGQLRQNRGIFSINTTCPRCRGAGTFIKDPCHSCGGEGISNARKPINIKIPTGIDSGQSIRISGEGNVRARNETPGDLYIKINILAHDHFERDHNDLYCTAHINVTQAVLGAVLQLKNIDDETIKVTIPAGVEHGDVLRVKDKGMPRLQRRNARGDLMIRIHINIPKNLPSKVEKLYKEISELTTKSNHTQLTLSPLREKRSFWKFRS